MRKILTFALLGFVALLICSTCVGGAKGRGKSDSEGILKIENRTGIELAIYVDQAYIKTAKSGQNLSIPIYDVKAVGKRVEIDCFYRSKLNNLSSYPTNREARYNSFPTVVMPLSNPTPVIPICIRALSTEELSNDAGINNVLVKFSYNDLPQIRSTVSVFTGSQDQPNEIVPLKNGETKLVPMKPDYYPIAMDYTIGTIKDGNVHYVYPKTQTQRNDRRFGINVPEGVTETEHQIPTISNIFNVTYVSNNPATLGTLRVKNQSSSQVRIRMGGGTKGEEPIATNNAVTNDVPYRNFLISAGNYYLRAVDVNEAFNEIARIEDIKIEPGMIYYWFIQNQNSSLKTGINMSVSQQVNNWFQDWRIKSSPEAKITLRITSTAEGVQNTRRDIGVTNRSGELVLRNIDIGDLIRGLSTDNAKKVTLTIIAEKDECYPVSQSISAYNLLEAGKEFMPDVFSLEKMDMKNAEIKIGDPIIP
jgi:hypothetical protein